MEKGAAKLIAIVAVVLIAVNGFALYTYMNNDSGDDPSGTVIVIDNCNREVKVPAHVTKVVCNAAGSLRIVSYLGAYEMVVGIDNSDSSSSTNNDFATYLLAYDYSKVKNIGNADNEASYKAIAESGAQVIISSKATAEQLDVIQEKTGIPVVGIDAGGSTSICDANFKKNIEIVGKALGKEQRAKELLSSIQSMESELESYAKKTSSESRSYIGGLMYMKQGGLYMTTGNYISFQLSHAYNVMPDKSGLPYNIELPSRLVEADPDYMFIDCINRDKCKTQYNENKEVLKNIPAIANGKNYIVYADKYYGTNWETELMNAYLIGNILHPDEYSYDVKEKLNSVLKAFFPGSTITVDVISEKQGWNPGDRWL